MAFLTKSAGNGIRNLVRDANSDPMVKKSSKSDKWRRKIWISVKICKIGKFWDYNLRKCIRDFCIKMGRHPITNWIQNFVWNWFWSKLVNLQHRCAAPCCKSTNLPSQLAKIVPKSCQFVTWSSIFFKLKPPCKTNLYFFENFAKLLAEMLA